MFDETFLTQAQAARFLQAFFEKRGKPDPRNFGYLLTDQRRGRSDDPIPHLKLKGRVIYRLSDLESWAEAELVKGKMRSPGVYKVSGATAVERLAKLRVALA